MRANTSALCLCNVNTKRPFAFTQEATVNRPYAFTCHSRTKTQVSRPCAFTINTKRPFAFTQEATVNRPYAFTCHSRTKTQISRPCAFRINQLCAFFTKTSGLLSIIESRGTLDYANRQKPRAIATTLEVTVTTTTTYFYTHLFLLWWASKTFK